MKLVNIKRIALLTLGMAICSVNTMAQKEFTLEDLNFGGRNYRNFVAKNQYYTWWGDQLIRQDVEECYIVDKKTGKESKLFSLDEINLWAKSNDQKRVRHLLNANFPYPTQPIVAVGNGKAFTLVNFQTRQIVWQDSLSGQKANDWQASSRATAFVRDHQLFVIDVQGQLHQITTDGSRDIVYGEAVHRNEFGIHQGTFWNPDGSKLAFYRMDQSMVEDYPQVDIFSPIALHEPDKYPMAGKKIHQVSVGIFDLHKKSVTYLKTSSPVDRYFTNISWSPDGKRVYMFELNRDQNDCQLMCYDAETGEKTGEIYRETHEKYVEPSHPIMFLPWDDKKFIMQSQKDGYNHLYLFDSKGRQLQQITSGKWVVLKVLGFNTKNKSIIFESNECHPLQRNLFQVHVKGGKRTLLDNGRGVHNGTMSASGEWVIDNYSEPDVPRNIDIVQTNLKSRQRLLTAENPWKGYKIPIFESGTIKAADGTTDLFFRMVKPADFTPERRYPTVIYVYGGPHAHNVQASWNWYSRSWETYMAQKGYIVFILDNRGSENRGRDFEQATFRQLGQIEMLDQMQGVEYLKKQPFVDTGRIGVHGWSFGGFMTISLMTNYPDVFKVGVAGGPVIDWKWYEAMYGERYMDTPQNNPEGYEKTSLMPRAKDLKGKLQIITGYNDPVVLPQHCLSFLAECIKQGTQPDFFVYPGEEHNMRGHQSVHLHERITQYFEDYLK